MNNIIDNEIWVDIKDCSKRYQISNHGRIKNKKDNSIMKLKKNSSKKGKYLFIQILDDEDKLQSPRIHRLVAEHFVLNDDTKRRVFIKHIDDNYENNYSYN